MTLIEDDLSIWSVLLVSAGIPTLERSQAHLTGVLPALNSLVEKMQHPVLAARLRQELQQLQADLPSSLLSYEELLAYLVWLTGVQARDWAGATDADIQADIHSAVRAEAEMLPKLVPNNLHLCFAAIRAAEWLADHTVPLSHTPISVRLLKDLMQRAEQQGSDFIVALCGYELADLSKSYCTWGASIPIIRKYHRSIHESCVPPSAFLGFLQQARVAHERCQALLPKQWTAMHKSWQQRALALKPWMQQQQPNNESWELLGPQQNKVQPRAGNSAGQLVRATQRLWHPVRRSEVVRQMQASAVLQP